jgi:hypothetical protein
MRLTKGDAPVDQLRCPRNDEQRVAIPLDLRMLMCVAGIFDCQIVQTELRLQALQEISTWLQQANPDDLPRPLRPFACFLDGDIFDAAPTSIDARCNDAGLAVTLRDSR